MRRLGSAWIFVTVATLGCGGTEEGTVTPGADATIKGKVTWKGEPVKVGTIEFVDESGGVNCSFGIRDGQYSSEGLSLVLTSGPKKVKIYGGEFKKSTKETGTGVMHSGGVVKEQLNNVIPPEYNDNTTLEATIKPGENSVDFSLPM